jgi:hypothetical protein
LKGAIAFILALVAALVSADARGEVGPSTGTARGTVTVKMPAISGIRIAYDPEAKRAAGVPVAINVYSSTSQLIVQRTTPLKFEPYLRVKASAPAPSRRAGSGWSTFTDEVQSPPARTSSRAVTDADVVYEIWAF